MVSVICPVFNEEKYIKNCIKSILKQDYNKNNLEVLFVDGGSIDKTKEIITSYQKKHNHIRLLHNQDKIVPYAMNLGIEKAIGDIIIRIDAHSYFPTDYVSTLVYNLDKLGADNVGVACITDVFNKNNKTLAIKEVLSNKYGVGNSLFRIGVKDVQEVDTVPFGCYKKEVFEKFGNYNVKLKRNQDIEFNKRLKRNGGKIYLLPYTNCIYYARETFNGVAKNNYENGKWNIFTVFYTKMVDSLSIRHFIPLIFILSLILPVIGGFLWKPIFYIAVISLITYLGLIISVCVNINYNKKIKFLYLFVSFIILHISYGFGSLAGIIRFPFLK
ncbi:glycosyl transferase [Polaribacter pacificus]|uniref:Glycosyl transferase n=1 Tax=Polaribacter pacificus TaxID=1775173 RepID=A0A917I1V6_9FLAO|nr:glycosyltransferase family 2 protein [Polaribacter pacificus]GGH01634.1 glycosyl transferase [Polaribacter pacificus]